MAASASQGRLHAGSELLQHIQRHKRLYRSRKSAAVHSVGASALQQLIAQGS